MPDLAIEQREHRGRAVWWTILTVIVGLMTVWIYFRYEQDTSHFIRELGPLGIVAAILLMALLCVIPFPAEFLMVVDMQVFGVWRGILYVWIGAMIGAFVTFLFAKRFGSRWMRRIVSKKHLEQLDAMIASHGAWGLFMARLIPMIPFVVLNYATAMISEVGTFTYLWTTGLGILPYDLGAALVFLGFSKRLLIWLIVGGLAIVAIWSVTLFARRQYPRVESTIPSKGAPAR